MANFFREDGTYPDMTGYATAFIKKQQEQRIQQTKNKAEHILKKYPHVQVKVFLYGSVARNDFLADSDTDILILHSGFNPEEQKEVQADFFRLNIDAKLYTFEEWEKKGTNPDLYYTKVIQDRITLF